MKKRFIRHGFNMVEVALALAIIAIGISSILVLFPGRGQCEQGGDCEQQPCRYRGIYDELHPCRRHLRVDLECRSSR